MSIRMHRYPDGLTGLAAFCDVCGEQITEHGWVVWKDPDDNGQPAEALIIHQMRCDPGHAKGYHSNMPLESEIRYLAHSIGMKLDQEALDH